MKHHVTLVQEYKSIYFPRGKKREREIAENVHLFLRDHPTLYQHLKPKIPDARELLLGQEHNEDKPPRTEEVI